MEKKILVTGANGMVGRALVSELLVEGYSVLAGVCPGANTVFGKTSPKSLVIREFDINSCDWDELLDGVTDVIHLAAVVHVYKRREQDWDKFYRTNVAATEKLCRSLPRNNVKRLIFLSTIGVYGDHPVIDENGELIINPTNMYSKSKLLGEKAIRRSLDDKVPWVILRPVMVYGPGDRGNMGRMIEAIKNNRFLIPGSGSNLKSAIFVEDLVGIICRLLRYTGCFKQELVISNKHVLTVNEMCNDICQILGKRHKVPSVPAVILKLAGRLGDLFPYFPFSTDTIKNYLSIPIFHHSLLYSPFWVLRKKPNLSRL